MNTGEWLVSQGIDPLEAPLIPPAPDVAAKLEEERLEKLDKELAEFIRLKMPAELRERLGQLIDQKVKRAAEQGQATK